MDWNPGEAFPSLGIGHFIWYPAQVEAGFTESFPHLIAHLRARHITLPPWLEALQPFDAPWANREAFIALRDGPRAESLRRFLESHIAEQTAFMLARLQQAIPQLLAQEHQALRPALANKLEALCSTPQGWYALIDYVNFKGEGLAPGETHQGRGWGLLQVLQEMQGGEPAYDDFAKAAARVLSRRAELADNPIEHQWLSGWLKRLNTYRSQPMLD